MVTLRPRVDGANVGTWIGFRYFLSLTEEAVLQWFRDRRAGPGVLYRDHGLQLSVVAMSAQLTAVLGIDDVVTADVRLVRPGHFTVTLTADRDGGVTILRGRVTVALIRGAGSTSAPDSELTGLAPVAESAAAARLSPAGPAEPDVATDVAVPAGVRPEDALAPSFTWPWRAAYSYCRYSDRVAHSGFVRALEEVVDHYLEHRGLSVATLLADRSWIPVVSRARVRLLADAHLEERMYSTFTVTGVLRRLTYDGRMDCYACRGGSLVPVATAQVTHGYAAIRGPGQADLVELPDEILTALAPAQGDPR